MFLCMPPVNPTRPLEAGMDGEFTLPFPVVRVFRPLDKTKVRDGR